MKQLLGMIFLVLLLLVLLPVFEHTIPPPKTTPQEEPSVSAQEEIPSPVEEEKEGSITIPPEEPEKIIEEPIIETPQVSSQQTSTPPPVPQSNYSYFIQEINPSARQSVVNVICELRIDNHIRRTSGSGILVHKSGIVLTNSHVAYLAFMDEALGADSAGCTIRGGNPARPMFEAIPLHLSVSWIRENAEKLSNGSHTGTGEYDYALLLITEPLSSGASLSKLSTMDLNTTKNILEIEEEVLSIAYPAEFIQASSISSDLYLTSDVGIVNNIFTFSNDEPDLVTVGGSILAQKGASGGAIVDYDGSLVGLIVTSSKKDALQDRELGALTPYYLNKQFKEERGVSLTSFLSKSNFSGEASSFMQGDGKKIRKVLYEAFN